MTHVETSVEDGIATLSLSNPGRKNALSPIMRMELDQTLDRLGQDPQVRALMLVGAGTDFCSGGDISAMSSMADSDAERFRARMLDQHRTYRKLLEFDRPVIAAVDGVAFGAGFSLAMAADLVIASTRARFCLSFAKVGLVPDLGILYTLPRLIGMARARELIYSARELDAAQARDLGLVLEVTGAQDLMSRATQYARSMAGTSPVAFSLTKMLLARSYEMDLGTLLHAEASAQGIAFTSAHAQEAIGRFMRREPGQFQWPDSAPPDGDATSAN
ncbi:enoyl-CoA hydratase/isomerase family protein [Pseudoxanthomonas sp.]|uniref:enoyl-CoA hydratase/isomerase family protein n=1 Tax=Pseudoxanthomonas sp. TaxID=1871049 RepID=UPI0026316355|nr:enoyl-CoA hydratase/isomerase family protein [Pseudoxanthomonas sp.]WDS36927.1 MAG: enoyl-CoA hydratase/isomerase family protein [Pseudoxanthomonas sp.]